MGASVLVVGQVEGLTPVEQTAEIAGIDGVDAVLDGPYDLSQALGRPGEVRSPEVTEAAERVASARGDDAMLGIYVDDAANGATTVLTTAKGST